MDISHQNKAINQTQREHRWQKGPAHVKIGRMYTRCTNKTRKLSSVSHYRLETLVVPLSIYCRMLSSGNFLDFNRPIVPPRFQPDAHFWLLSKYQKKPEVERNFSTGYDEPDTYKNTHLISSTLSGFPSV